MLAHPKQLNCNQIFLLRPCTLKCHSAEGASLSYHMWRINSKHQKRLSIKKRNGVLRISSPKNTTALNLNIWTRASGEEDCLKWDFWLCVSGNVQRGAQMDRDFMYKGKFSTAYIERTWYTQHKNCTYSVSIHQVDNIDI